jgi:hypothetical protein
LDLTTRLLCSVMRSLSGADIDISDGLDEQTARELSEWWLEHKRLDKIREEEEQRKADQLLEDARKKAEQARLRILALSKLSNEERQALGV